MKKKQKKTIKEEIVAPKYNKNQRFVPLAQEKRETIKEEIKKELLKVMPVSLDEFIKKSYQERRWEVYWTVVILTQKILQRFMGETKIEKREESEDASDYRVGLRDGYNQALEDIEEKQLKWMEENL